MIIGDSANLFNTQKIKGVHLAMRSGIGRRGGFFWWMWLVNMPLARKASFFFDR